MREALSNLTSTYGDLRKHLYNDDGKLRSFVNIYLNDEDIRYLQKEDTAINAGDALSIIPSVAGGAPSATETERELPTLSAQEYQRYSRHLILPEVGLARAAQAEGGARPVRRRRRPRLAGRALPRGGRRRHDRHRRLRRRRPVEPAAADPARDRGRRPAQAGVGEGEAQRDQPRRQGRDLQRAALVEERARDLQGLRRRPRRHRQLPDALPRERRVRAAREAERLRHRSSASRARPRSSAPRTARATAASIPSRRRRGSCRAAPRAACSACCPASSA